VNIYEKNAQKHQETTNYSKNKFVSFFQKNADKVDQFIDQTFNEVKREAVDSLQDSKTKKWKDVAIRGAVEMIPIFGTAYFTYADNFQKPSGILKYNKQVSVFGIKELGKLIKKEYNLDKAIHEEISGYNPIDYWLQEPLRS